MCTTGTSCRTTQASTPADAADQTEASSLLQRTILLWWAAWLSAVATTNALDALQALGALADSFKFVSGNCSWINQVMDPLGVPRGLQAASRRGEEPTYPRSAPSRCPFPVGFTCYLDKFCLL